MFRDVTSRFKGVEARLGERVVGQRKAIDAVARRLVLNKGPLKDGFDRPDGVLLFLGPTGVGKTELAKSVAQFLFGDAKKMIRVDMSEYQDGAVAVDKLIGMPRGIVGSERGGVLTNQLKDSPYCVVLLDEVEKASPSMLNLFLQAFDEGWVTDGRGKRVYLSDAIVIMTSNIGCEHFRKLTNPFGFYSKQVGVEQIQGEITRELERRFSPEFRNRIDEVVMFSPLTKDEVRQITLMQIDMIEQTLGAERTLADRVARSARAAGHGRLQPGLRRPVPEARHRERSSSCRSARCGPRARRSRRCWLTAKWSSRSRKHAADIRRSPLLRSGFRATGFPLPASRLPAPNRRVLLGRWELGVAW